MTDKNQVFEKKINSTDLGVNGPKSGPKLFVVIFPSLVH